MHAELTKVIDGTLTQLVRDREARICLIDPPGHSNVGDSAILLGELHWIKTRSPSAQIRYYDVNSYSADADRYIEESTLILLHGGGNFGDIWPDHHALRIRILERFSHKTIVQLPQSIHFSTNATLNNTADVINKQKNFTLIVRDHLSYELARKHFDCRLELIPDMAFAMPPISRLEPAVDIFCLLRQDKEGKLDAAAMDRALLHLRDDDLEVEAMDWLDRPRTLSLRVEDKLLRLTKARPNLTFPVGRSMTQLRTLHARERLTYGIKLLSRGRSVVTDRLHAHILCCMLEIPHVTFDSFDGKISAFHQTWTKDLATVRFARNDDPLQVDVDLRSFANAGRRYAGNAAEGSEAATLQQHA